MPSAQEYSCSITLTASDFATYLSLSFIGIMFSLLLIAVSYMLGEVLNYSALKGWYKTEMWEVSKSIIIIAVVFASIVIASAIVNMFVGIPQSTQISSQASMFSSLSTNMQGLCVGGQNYLAYGLANSYLDFATMLGISQGIAALKSVVIGTWSPFPIVPPFIILTIQFGSIANLYTSSYIETLSPTAVFSFIKDMFSMIIFPMLYIFQFQYDLLGLIIAFGLAVLLPIGIFLRAMPFTRGIGGTFIALGIGASLVYPALLVGFNAPISSYLSGVVPPQPVTPTTFSCPSGISGLGCEFGEFTYSILASIISSSIGGGFLINLLLGSPFISAPNFQLTPSMLDTGYIAG
ncbi:MAG: hypothetical protein ACP5SA_03510, partial [Candidatus Micrarchaeia archaeon]